MKDKRTFKVLVWKRAVTGKSFMPSHVVDVSHMPAILNPDHYQEATLTLSPKPKTKGKDKT